MTRTGGAGVLSAPPSPTKIRATGKHRDHRRHRRNRLKKNHISWISPLARALMKSRAGDTVVLHAPGGREELEVTDVRHERVEVDPFVPLVTQMPNDRSR